MFKMWQELRSVCRCPCPTLASHQSLCRHHPMQQAVKRAGLHSRVKKFFYFIPLLKKLEQEVFGDRTGERGFFFA